MRVGHHCHSAFEGRQVAPSQLNRFSRSLELSQPGDELPGVLGGSRAPARRRPLDDSDRDEAVIRDVDLGTRLCLEGHHSGADMDDDPDPGALSDRNADDVATVEELQGDLGQRPVRPLDVLRRLLKLRLLGAKLGAQLPHGVVEIVTARRSGVVPPVALSDHGLPSQMVFVYIYHMLIRRTASVAAVVMAEAGALVILYRLGSYGPTAVEWGDLGRWLADTPPEDVLVALVRVAALALTWWIAASTILYVLARMTRVPGLVRAVEWTTLPSVRRLVDGVAVTTIAAGSVLGTSGVAAAAPADRNPVVVQLGAEGPSVTTAPRYRPRPAGSGDTVGTAPATAVAAVTTAPPARTTIPSDVADRGDGSSSTAGASEAPDDAASYVVQPGDSLWKVAERHLANLTGRSETDVATPELGRYWARLVDQNRGRLRSGDPDLIYPGEHLTLPPSADSILVGPVVPAAPEEC